MLAFQVSTIVFTVINLLVLYFILRKLLFGRVNAVLEQRAARVKETIDSAEASKCQAEELRAEYEDKLTDARQEAAKLVADAQNRAQRAYEAKMADAETDAKRLRSEAEAQIASERDAMLRGARNEVASLALLAAARRMAGGDLATPVEGDMGLFDPLKDELNQVRAGFEKAVAAEVRSQNMKTELITNVSHDLKTPLTAIITYVDLLKDPALSAEDRAKYIETLDKKSQRLKRLIEDLFEVSKAATRNVAMHYAEVDLAALLKQVQYELADKTEASGIDFRWQLPEERMPLVLDGQKTCRIFENLVVNITKYGMPGTRAYITLMPQEHGAQVVFKNISATELDFSAEEITDRFVRGDRSRNTEGSGLGLAIAKSFAELQGGTFSITVDGDLFKACVIFPEHH